MLPRRLTNTLLGLYWRILKPRTFGVKGVILNPENRNQLLLVHHSYGAQDRWNLPGGGYNPKRETPEEAIRRELREELSFDCKAVDVLGDYYTDAQGKRDTVTILLCKPLSLEFRLNNELIATKWVALSEIQSSQNYYRVVRRAVELVLKAGQAAH